MRFLVLSLPVFFVLAPANNAQAPTFEIARANSWIKFDVKASTTIAGKFDKWKAALEFASPDETTGQLDIEIEAASVDTGSGLKNRKLKSKDFFDVEQNPLIAFKSTRFAQAAKPDTYEVDGNFTIRGVSNPEKLTLTLLNKETDSSEITGEMVFNRKDYGMNKGIPFIKIADHVDVKFHLKGKRLSGPALAYAGHSGPESSSERNMPGASEDRARLAASDRAIVYVQNAFGVIADGLLLIKCSFDCTNELFLCARFMDVGGCAETQHFPHDVGVRFLTDAQNLGVRSELPHLPGSFQPI
jgi:polyisoprenoid-binding protein YceI